VAVLDEQRQALGRADHQGGLVPGQAPGLPAQVGAADGLLHVVLALRQQPVRLAHYLHAQLVRGRHDDGLEGADMPAGAGGWRDEAGEDGQQVGEGLAGAGEALDGAAAALQDDRHGGLLYGRRVADLLAHQARHQELGHVQRREGVPPRAGAGLRLILGGK
jgi:hypothetical protein